jgi:hypothetical protein
MVVMMGGSSVCAANSAVGAANAAGSAAADGVFAGAHEPLSQGSSDGVRIAISSEGRSLGTDDAA